MSTTSTHKVVAEVVPDPASAHFEQYACAAASFFIRASETVAASHCVSELAAAGWILARLVTVERVVCPPELAEKLSREQSVCCLRRVRRRLLTFSFSGSNENGGMPPNLAALSKQFASALTGRSLVLRDRAGQSPSQIIVNGETLLPIWTNARDADMWCSHWDRRASVAEVRTIELMHALNELLDGDGLVALGLMPAALVTFHPASLISDLGAVPQVQSF